MKSTRKWWLLVLGMLFVSMWPLSSYAWESVINWDNKHETAADIWHGANAIYVTGTLDVSGANPDMGIAKVNFNGSLAWKKKFNNVNDHPDCSYAVAETSGGGIVIAGYTDNPNQGKNWRIVRYEPTNGDRTWTATHNNSLVNGDDVAMDITVDDNDNAYVAGYVWCQTGYGYNTAAFGLRKYVSTTGEVDPFTTYNYLVPDTPVFI